jgi:F-type H+-transporting ATPase subunit gamma
MSNTIASLQRKIGGATDLQSVVRTMKAVAASSIGQYEKSVNALADYYHTVELGLGACFRESWPASSNAERKKPRIASSISAVVLGSDQGLVGQFNDVVADFAAKTLTALPVKSGVWAVGERVHARLTDAGLPVIGLFTVPSSVKAIATLVGKFLLEYEKRRSPSTTLLPGQGEFTELYLFHNHPGSGAVYTPVSQRLLPLDEIWQRTLTELPWPKGNVPQIIDGSYPTLRGLVHEYLFVSLFRACAESLASENASRLAAMQRADKNISDLLQELSGTFQRLRQDSIDEELFDVITGFEALSAKGK